MVPQPSNPGVMYAKYLEELAEKSPPLFLCHFYNIYFSHIAGGQVIAKQVPITTFHLLFYLMYDVYADYGIKKKILGFWITRIEKYCFAFNFLFILLNTCTICSFPSLAHSKTATKLDPRSLQFVFLNTCE